MVNIMITVEQVEKLREGILPLWNKAGIGDAVLVGKRVGFHRAMKDFKLEDYLDNPSKKVEDDFIIAVNNEVLDKLIADFKWNCMNALWNKGFAQGVYFVLLVLGIDIDKKGVSKDVNV